MKENPGRQTPTPASGECDTPEERWKKFKDRLQLENSTKVPMAEQIKLEMIPAEDIQLFLKKFAKGTHLRIIHRYIQFDYNIKIDCQALERFWRRKIPGFIEVEAQRRELRTAVRAMKSLS